MKKGAIIGLILVIVLGGGGLGAFFGGQSYFSSQVQQAEIDISSVEITSMENNQLDFDAVIQFSSNVPLDAEVLLKEVHISYESHEFGNVEISNPVISTNQTEISFTGTVSVNDPEIYQSLAADLLSNPEVEVSLSGSVEFSAIVYTMTASFDKVVNLAGFNGLNPELSNIEVIGGNSTDLLINCDVAWENPTDLELTLDDLEVNLYYQQSLIGVYSFGEITIDSGSHKESIELPVDASSTDLMVDFVQEESIVLEYGLVPDLGIENQTEPSEIYRDSITLAGLDQLPLKINNMHLVNYTEAGIEMEMDLNYTNPTDITVQMHTLEMEVNYKNQNVGSLLMNDLVLSPGDNNLRINITLNPSSTTLMDDFINLDVLTFYLNGFANMTGSGGDQIFLFSKRFELEGFKGLPLSIESFELVNLTKTEMGVHVEVLVTNEALLETSIPLLAITVDYKGITVAYEEYTDVPLEKGVNNYEFNVDLNLTSYDLVSEFILENSMTFEITAQAQYGVANVLQEIHKNYTVVGMGGLQLQINSLIITNATTDSLNLTISGSFNNPTIYEFPELTLYINIYYNETLISQRILPTNLTELGNDFEFWFVVDEPTVIDEIIDLYMHTEEIPFVYNITAEIFDRNITFTGNYNVSGLGGMVLDVADFSLSQAESSYIEFLVKVNVTLPSGLVVNPHNISSDIYYNGSYLGNAFLEKPILSPGVNLIDLFLNISGHSANVEEFISEYLNGNDVDFQINTSIAVYSLNITKSFNFTMTGVSEDLLAVSVSSINIDIVGFSYTVNLDLTFNNPTSIDINVTAFSGTIDFDDIDGAQYGFYSYGSSINYLLDTVNEDWSSSSIFVGAQNTANQPYQFLGSDIETTVRLYDDYLVDNNLLIDVIGTLTIQIGSYSIDVAVELMDIPVD